MIIPVELLTSCRSNSYGYYNMSGIEIKDIAILIIMSLHLNKKITDTKMFAMFKQYREGTLIRKVNTYHCKINDKWYNDTSTFEAIMDCYNDLCIKGDLSLETCLSYFNKLFNMNRNYCIDHFYFSYVKPIINNMNNRDGLKILNRVGIRDLDFITFEKFKSSYGAMDGYCCEDCDGCPSQYARSRYTQHIGRDYMEKYKDLAKGQLNAHKNSSGLKNPHNRLAGGTKPELIKLW